MCSKETKDINVKAFYTITNKHEAKTITKHISCDCKCKFNSATCNLNLKWNNKKHVNVNLKIIITAIKIIVVILAHVFARIANI